ncbi:TAP42-like protein, partial [Kipferlia bialata]
AADSYDSTPEERKALVKDLIECLDVCNQIVDKNDLFGADEGFDEVHTELIRYMLVPFYLGHTLSSHSM